MTAAVASTVNTAANTAPIWQVSEELLGSRIEVYTKCDKLDEVATARWQRRIDYLTAGECEPPAADTDRPERRERRRRRVPPCADSTAAVDAAEATEAGPADGVLTAAAADGSERRSERGRRKVRRRSSASSSALSAGDADVASPGVPTASDAGAEAHRDGKLRPLPMLASARTGEGIEALNAAIAARLARRTGRSRQTIELPVSAADTGERLTYLHRHPRITVAETSVSDDGETMLITVDADEDAVRTFAGQRWGGSSDR